MKHILLTVCVFVFAASAFGQDEQAPIIEKEIEYKNWIYKDVRTDEAMSLREMAEGKKLVAVVYFAPWCPDWKHDAPQLVRLYEKYKKHGFEVIGVGEYDTVEAMRANLDAFKIGFPVVYESRDRFEKQKTKHFAYRVAAGDKRGWGSPWYIFLEPGKMTKTGDVLVTKANLINGEIIEADVERFIREKLGLAAEKAAK